ncbi:MAG: hypothetical protein ACQESR_16790 [Planctomycetota bacterium]
MESCPTQAVLPLVGLAAEKVIRDRYTAFDPVLHCLVPSVWKKDVCHARCKKLTVCRLVNQRAIANSFHCGYE